MISIRPSGIGGFFECSYRWFRDTIHNPIRRVSYKAHYGSALHKASEMYYKESISSNNWANYSSDYESLSIDTFRELVKTDETEKITENINSIESQLAVKTKDYIKNAANLNSNKLPIAVEKSYEVKIKSSIIDKVYGTLDIVGDNYIIDIKTMSKMKNPKDYLIQQSAYAMLRKFNGEKVDDLLIHRVLTHPTKNNSDCVSILEAIDNKYLAVSDLIEKSKFYINTIVKTCENFNKTGNEILFRGNPNSVLCSSLYCVYYDTCPYRKN